VEINKLIAATHGSHKSIQRYYHQAIT